jgi:hypothetical protein
MTVNETAPRELARKIGCEFTILGELPCGSGTDTLDCMAARLARWPLWSALSDAPR